MFELEVTGCSGTYPGPGRMCSGYLVRTDEARVVVDLGNGSLGNLQLATRLDQIDAVVLTHHHPDHCVDLIGLYYGLRFHPDGPRTIDVYAPEGTAEHLAPLLSTDTSQTFFEVCRFQTVAAGDRREVKDLTLDFHASVHPVPTVSVRVGNDGRVIAYSSDSAGGSDLVAAARGADLFVCEATWPAGSEGHPPDVHLDPADAGAVARDAEVGRLVLTHLWPINDRAHSAAAARTTFDGEVAVAEDRQVWTVT